MPSFREYSRRAIQPFIVLILVVCYVLILLPLSKRASDLDKPLNKEWRKLAVTLGRTNAVNLDFQQIEAQLGETRSGMTALAAAEQKAIARLQHGPVIRDLLAGPFRLIDYQNELSQYVDEAISRAKAQKVHIAPAVFDGLPQHRVEIPEQVKPLLWAALRMTEDALDVGIACGVTAIHSLEVHTPFANGEAASATNRWVQVCMELELSASTPAAMRFLQSLPLRSEELKPAGLPEASPEKSVLLIDRLVIKRQTPEKADEVRVWVRAAGFIQREQ